jgi:hypothetical protein
LLPLEVRLDIDETFVGWVEPDDISDATSAARISGLKEFHVCKMDVGKSGLGSVEASSLYAKREGKN